MAQMRVADNTLKKYFKIVNGNIFPSPTQARFYVSIFDLLQEGKYFKPQKLTEKEIEIVKSEISSLGFEPEKRMCFYNAQMLAVNSRHIKYHEGYGLSIIPVLLILPGLLMINLGDQIW